MKRTLVREAAASHFLVEVYVEGYRPTKDVWLHESYSFPFSNVADSYATALDEVKKFVGSLGWGKNDEILNFESAFRDYGWYGLSYEYYKVFEISGGSRYEIEFEKGELPCPKHGENGIVIENGKAVYE